MKKTDRKNKTNLSVTWPTNIFTIKELNVANPDFVEITLRVRLKKSVDTGEVNEVGVLHNGKGRPTIVFAYGPITEQHITEAKNREVLLKDDLRMKVTTVSSETPDTNVEVETTAEVTTNVETETVTQ